MFVHQAEALEAVNAGLLAKLALRGEESDRLIARIESIKATLPHKNPQRPTFPSASATAAAGGGRNGSPWARGGGGGGSSSTAAAGSGGWGTTPTRGGAQKTKPAAATSALTIAKNEGEHAVQCFNSYHRDAPKTTTAQH